MEDLAPGTRVTVTLPFAKRPFEAVISDRPCLNPSFYRITVDRPSRATLPHGEANVYKGSCVAIDTSSR